MAAVAEVESTDADQQEEDVFVAGTPLKPVAEETDGIIFEEAMNNIGLFSKTDTVLDTTDLPLC